jgi:hypothetical protein
LCDKRLGKGPSGIDEHGNARGSRPQLTQEPKLLRRKFVRDEADTGDVAAGPVEAGDEAIPVTDWLLHRLILTRAMDNHPGNLIEFPYDWRLSNPVRSTGGTWQ